MLKRLFSFVILFLIIFTCQAQSPSKIWGNWKKGYSPLEVGNKLSLRFLQSPHTNYGRAEPPKFVTYPEVCTWFGALKFSRAGRIPRLTAELEKRYVKLVEEESALLPVPNHVDYTVFGALPLQLYLQTGKKSYLNFGREYADKQWDKPEGQVIPKEGLAFAEKGYSWQTRLWIDDMFMINAVQVQAFRATENKKYIDRAAREMVLYLDSLQKPNGLFYHAPDVPFYWARGNGWMAAGMTEILKSLPESNPNRKRILEGYQKMMGTLLRYQTEKGMWRQLIDDEDCWTESSGTAMFAYAMVSGVKRGWLKDEKYAPAARKAWIALVDLVEENGDVRDVCEGTNKKNDRQFYLDRKRLTGDMHGQAPVLWTAAALLE
ncbi:glycoside hydrolase family 88/105 protein [Desertivirga arenae]|uniref:glycoside hydrolase family 88/105 protein n=1 Tax=Desertivirga arenae TaxID=2810309 RepID=UPI001A975953|nr:glycoside hydrolase family 88 protein [Pedobacter sp. SYSU D00823]